MKSSWDTTRAKSTYHFDPKRFDNEFQAFTYLGKLENTWANDLDKIIKNSKPATWKTRGYKGEGVEAPPADQLAEEYDIERVGADPQMIITNLNWKIPKSLKTI